MCRFPTALFRFGYYFVEPVIAGLKADNSPYLMSSDIIGAQCFKDDFVVAGDTAETLFGMCESVYRCAHEREPNRPLCLLAPARCSPRSRGLGALPS